MESLTLDVVIVTWNRKTDLTRCLDSIREQSVRPDRVIVVDNGSRDGTCETIPRDYPEVLFLPQGENRGACAGRNIGMEQASGDLLFFLDDDTRLFPDCIQQILERFRSCPQLGALQPSILLPGMDPRKRSATALPNPHPISAAWCVRRNALPKKKPWPDHFIRQGEEMWVAMHLYERGYRSEHWPPARCEHFQSVGGQRDRIVFFFARNSFLLYYQRFPLALALPVSGYKILRTLVNVRSVSEFRSWFQGVRSGVAMILTGQAKRDPIGWKGTVRYLKDLWRRGTRKATR